MKKFILKSAIGLSIFLVLAACGNQDNGASENATPEQLFVNSCASCHGQDFKSGYAPDLNQIGSKYTAEEIYEIIENGIGNMPAGRLKGEDAQKVADWLAQNQ